MLGDVQPFQLLLLRDPERHECADELEQDERDPAGPDQRDGYPVKLQQYLLRRALDQARRAADRGGREHAGPKGAGDAADADPAKRSASDRGVPGDVEVNIEKSLRNIIVFEIALPMETSTS